MRYSYIHKPETEASHLNGGRQGSLSPVCKFETQDI